jgi:hypothetical protein
MSTKTKSKGSVKGRKPLWIAIVAIIAWLGISSVAGPTFGKLSTVQENDNAAFLPDNAESTVVLGGQQKWWLQSLLVNLDATSVYYGATVLTAVTDNAALTYLGSLVDGLSDEFKYSLVSGALTGGGLTVIANAPNPAGFSILKPSFEEGAISPLYLFLYALPPTIIAIIAFRFI